MCVVSAGMMHLFYMFGISNFLQPSSSTSLSDFFVLPRELSKSEEREGESTVGQLFKSQKYYQNGLSHAIDDKCVKTHIVAAFHSGPLHF